MRLLDPGKVYVYLVVETPGQFNKVPDDYGCAVKTDNRFSNDPVGV